MEHCRSVEPEISEVREVREGREELAGTCGVAVTGQTGLTSLGILLWRDVVVVLAELAVRPSPVAPAVLTLSTSPGLHVEFLVKTTLSGPVVTLAGCNRNKLIIKSPGGFGSLTQASVGVLRGGSLPPPVPVVPQTSLAVVSGGSVLTQTNTTTVRVIRVFGNTNIGVAVTFAAASHLEVSDPVVVRLQHFRVHEHFVSESVEADERNSANQNTS